MIKKIIHDELKVDSIYYLGDIHGNFSLIQHYIKYHGIKNCVIFQVGDFGIGFKKSESETFNKMNIILKENNIHLYAIRGNHDDPKYFNNKYIESNIFLIEDYTILSLKIENEIKNHFCLGGGISIDRKPRQKDTITTWWEDEIVQFVKDDEIINQITGIEIIVTHTAPDWLEPIKFSGIVYHFAKNDSNLLEELKNERKNMTILMNKIIANNKESLKSYYYGHFHDDINIFHENVRYRLLNVGELING